MASEYKLLTQSPDDVSLQDLSVEDEHFDIANTKEIRRNNVHNATKNLLEHESGDVKKLLVYSLETASFVDISEEENSSHKQNENHKASQNSGSGVNSDGERNDRDGLADTEPVTYDSRPIPPPPREYDPSIDDRLPETVTVLKTPEGGKLYLIGTAHFSEESQDDVSAIIQAVQPHIVMVELCKARVHILSLDEKTILREAETLSFVKIREIIQQNGPYQGLLYVLMLNMSAHLTRELGIAPGGEFRRAFTEAKQVPNCLVHLGDRPINITLDRALSSLSWWQRLKLGWHLIRYKEPISREEVERCKRRDKLEELLAELAGEYPTLGEIFVNERDIYLTHSLQLACLPQRTPTGWKPSRVVGVVGIGHMPGIVENWGKVQPSDILPIMRIPPQSLSSKIIRITLKVSLVGAVIYVGYKIIPMPSVLSLQSLRSSFEGLLKVSASR